MITIVQESLRAEAELAGHCDHKEVESSLAPVMESSLFSGEMKLVFSFPVLTFTNGIQNDVWFVVI